jgi:hypothetical protein
MNFLRSGFTLMLAIIGMTVLTGVGHGRVTTVADELDDRVRSLGQTFTTPPAVSSDQRWLQIAAIAAVQSHATEPGMIMDAYQSAGSLVTYYLHAETLYVWDGIGWEVDSRSTYSYTTGNLTEIISESWMDDHWEFDSRTVQTYDGADHLLTILSQIRESDQWVNSYLMTFVYNGSGLASEFIQQVWQAGAWANLSRTLSTYSGNLMSVQTYQVPNGLAWTNQGRNSFSYNGSNQISEILNEGWGDPLWYYLQRTTNTHSGANLTLALTESYDIDEVDLWRNLRKTDYAYDGANEVLNANFTWSTITGWTPTVSDTSRYSAGRLSENVFVLYQAGQPAYVARDLYAYDALGNLVEDISQAETFASWFNTSRVTYYYTTSGIFDSDGAVVPAGIGLGQNFPNPFNSSTVIPYALPSDNHVTIVVTNILGQSVVTLADAFQSAGSYTVVWDGLDANGRSVASGIYFFRVQVGDVGQVRKMVLLK